MDIGGHSMNHYIEFPKLFGGIRPEASSGWHFRCLSSSGDRPHQSALVRHHSGSGQIFAYRNQQALRYQDQGRDLLTCSFIALPVSVIFSRLFYVVFKFDEFKNNLVRILYIWEGGVAFTAR